MRLTDVANQMEETRKENDSLITQVFKLQRCAIILFCTLHHCCLVFLLTIC